MAFVFPSLRCSCRALLLGSGVFPAGGAAVVFFVLPGRLGIVQPFHPARRIARRSSVRSEFPTRRLSGDPINGNYGNGRKYAFNSRMDPFLEYQRGLLLTIFVCWGIALILAGSMRFLVRNAEAWKSRLVRALSQPSVSSESFGEQAVLPLDFRPCCPNCRQPMLERRTRKLGQDNAFLWSCSQFPRCRGTRIEMGGRAIY